MNELVSSLIRILPFAVILLVFRQRINTGKLDPTELDLNKPLSATRFWSWWAGFLAFMLLTEYSLYQAGLLETAPWKGTLAPSVLRIGGAVLLAPAAEELLFRGLFLNKLRQRLPGDWLPVILQALVFVAVHNFAYDNSLGARIGVVQTFIDACLYALARTHTRSLYTPMAMHATGNLIATLERFIL